MRIRFQRSSSDPCCSTSHPPKQAGKLKTLTNVGLTGDNPWTSLIKQLKETQWGSCLFHPNMSYSGLVPKDIEDLSVSIKMPQAHIGRVEHQKPELYRRWKIKKQLSVFMKRSRTVPSRDSAKNLLDSHSCRGWRFPKAEDGDQSLP